MKIPEYKIRSTYEVSETHEISVDWNGDNFLVIYGKHINGWFIAIPNWQVCTEAGEPGDVLYNIEKLSAATDIENAICVIARAIKENWESINADL
uniref:Phage protein n=1 Tax=Dulem virus 39 TaxID=3145757 RepID=A0AAU8B5D3_9CAUD